MGTSHTNESAGMLTNEGCGSACCAQCFNDLNDSKLNILLHHARWANIESRNEIEDASAAGPAGALW